MAFLASTFWFLVLLLFLFLFRKLRYSFAKWFQMEEEKGLRLHSLLFYGTVWLLLAALIYRLPILSPLYQKSIASAILVLFLCHSFYHTVRFLERPKLSRTVSLSLLMLISCYGALIVWEQAPHPLHIPEWFHQLPQYSQQLVSFSLSLIAAVFCYSIGFDIATRLAQQTKTALDDRLISIFRTPLSVSVLFVGINYGVTLSTLSTFWEKTYHSSSLGIIILLWSSALLKASTVVLNEMKEGQTTLSFLNARTLPIFHIFARIFIVITAVYLLLLAWGIDAMLWITSAGVIGIAIAYASQDTLASLFAGIAILSDAPYKLGDYLVLGDGTKGKVSHIGFRSTRLITVANIEIIIPNANLASAQIINMSGGNQKQARIDIAAGVAYGSDIDRVREILYEIANELDYVIHDNHLKPVVHFVSMGASSLDFVLRIWIDHPEQMLSIQDQANTLIYKRFSAEKIEIPYTKQDVYLYPMGEISVKK